MKVNRERLRQLVRVSLECEEEDRTYVGEFQCEDGSNDTKIEEWIRKELRSGNQWAWCSAKVTVKYRDLEAVDYLGGCSYESEEDFKKGGYYDSMINDAVEELAKELEKLINVHGLWETGQPTMCLFCIAEGPG